MPPTIDSVPRTVRFAAVGGICTLLYLVIYVVIREVLPAQVASLVALLISALVNTALNRRMTFGLEGRTKFREHVQGLLTFAIGAAMTSGALAVLHAATARPDLAAEIAVLLLATAIATVVRFVLFARWVFADRGGPGTTDRPHCGARAQASNTQEDHMYREGAAEAPPEATADGHTGDAPVPADADEDTDTNDAGAPAPFLGMPAWLIAVGVVVITVAAWLFVLIATGSPSRDVVEWTVAVVLGVLAPGFALVRLTQRAPAPIIEDLAWAAPAGCLVALLGWFLGRIQPVTIAPWALGPVLVVLAVLVPWSRRRLLARPGPGWGVGPSAALGATMLVSIAWMAQTGLRAYKAFPSPSGQAYYPDIMYQLDLLGELKHSLVPTYPPVAGSSLSYHWFLYAIDAHLTSGTGIAPLDSIERLAPATLVPAILVLAAVVARRISGLVWAGPIAAILLGVLEISQASRWTSQDGSIGLLPRIWRASPPQTMGWFAAIAATGTICAFLHRKPRDRTTPVLLLVPFLVLCAGSKSSELPVVISGVGVAGLVMLLRRQWRFFWRCVIIAAVGLAIFEAAFVTIYKSNSYGVGLKPFGVVLSLITSTFATKSSFVTPGQRGFQDYDTIAVGTATLLFLLPLLPRLLGLLFQVRYRVGDPAGWMCLGTAVAGVGISLVTRHPAGSEQYFMLSAYPIGVLGAASGLAVAGRRVRAATAPALRRWWPAVPTGMVVLGALAAAAVAYTLPDTTPLARFRAALARHQTVSTWHVALGWLQPWLRFGAIVVVVVLILWLALRAARSRARVADRRGPAALLAFVCLTLGAGLFTMTLQFHGTLSPVGGSPQAVREPAAAVIRGGRLPTEPDAFAAGAYVRTHSSPSDVVATNLYCRYDRYSRNHRGRHCDPRNFVASALTERHTLVGGWAYADRIVGSPIAATVLYRNLPFWDQALLAQQYSSFARPTRSLLDYLYRHHHVRWLYVDLRDKPVAAGTLDRLAIRRFTGPTTAVWQLRKP